MPENPSYFTANSFYSNRCQCSSCIVVRRNSRASPSSSHLKPRLTQKGFLLFSELTPDHVCSAMQQQSFPVMDSIQSTSFFVPVPFIPSLPHFSFFQLLFHSSFTHWVRNSIIHSILHSFIHSLIDSFILSFIQSIIQSFIHSVVRSFLRSLVHSVMPSFVHSFNESFNQSFNHSIVQSCSHAIIHSCIHSFMRPFVHSRIYAAILSFSRSVNHAIIPFIHVFFRWEPHFKILSAHIGFLLPIVTAFFRNFRPGACRALPLHGAYNHSCRAGRCVFPFFRCEH